jgi:hypothetical protein
MAAKQPDITVFYLEKSRAIRPVWALEALGVPYKLEITGRDEHGKVPQAFGARTACIQHSRANA